MANIAQLPNAARGVPDGPYGPHLQVTNGTLFGTALTTSEGTTLAAFDGTKYDVELALLTPETVPYVNRFVAPLRIEKYWRTGSYRFVGSALPKPVARPVPIVAPAGPTLSVVDDDVLDDDAPVAPTVTATSAPAPVFVVNDNDDHDLTIPGLEHPAKVKVTAYAPGYVKVGDVVVPDADLVTLQDAWKLAQQGEVANVLITGPSGTAKTALARAFAASQGVPFLKVDGGSVRTADDWSGAFRQDPNTKTWAHRWSPFAQLLRAGQPAVICTDELNRTESPQALNALLGLLDWTGSLAVPDANTTLHLPKGILLIATANIGPEFVGTLPLDGAVRQRFPFGIRLDYPIEAVEVKLLVDRTGISKDIAGGLVRMAAQQRVNRDDPQQYPSGAVISTRVILDIAKRIALCDTDPRDAVISTLNGQFDPGDEVALGVVVDTQFPEEVEAEKLVETDEAEPSTEPLIVVGRHWFSRAPYGSNTCDFSTPAQPVCGKGESDPIHFN